MIKKCLNRDPEFPDIKVTVSPFGEIIMEPKKDREQSDIKLVITQQEKLNAILDCLPLLADNQKDIAANQVDIVEKLDRIETVLSNSTQIYTSFLSVLRSC